MKNSNLSDLIYLKKINDLQPTLLGKQSYLY